MHLRTDKPRLQINSLIEQRNNMDAKQITAGFLSGRLDIAEYRRLFDEGQELEVFLQKIVDDIKASDGKIEPYILF